MNIRLLDQQSVYAVAVEPGVYKIEGFTYAPYGTHAKWEVKRFPLPTEHAFLKEPFQARAGEAVYLGDFYGSSKRAGFGFGGDSNFFIVSTGFKGSLLGYDNNFSQTTRVLLQSSSAFENVKCCSAFDQKSIR